MSDRPTNAVVVAGGGIGRFARFPGLSLTQIAAPVIRDALAGAQLRVRDIQAAFVGNAFGGTLGGQESILAQVLLSAAGIVGIPVRTIKNACSSGSEAAHLAWSAVAYGQYDCVLVLGAEKLTHQDKKRVFDALASATDRPPASDNRSILVDVNAARARQYMESYGA